MVAFPPSLLIRRLCSKSREKREYFLLLSAVMSCASCGSADAGRCHTSPRLPVLEWSHGEPSYLRSPHQIDGVGGGRRALIWHQCRGEPCCVIWGFISRCQNARISYVWWCSYAGKKKAGFGWVMLNSFNDEDSVGDCHLFFIWGTWDAHTCCCVFWKTTQLLERKCPWVQWGPSAPPVHHEAAV